MDGIYIELSLASVKGNKQATNELKIRHEFFQNDTYNLYDLSVPV